jgi:hypothetical protein
MIIPFINAENIWELTNLFISTIYIPRNNCEFKQPANIQVNLKQQIQLSNKIVFTLKSGKNIHTFKYQNENILYFSKFGSNQLVLARVISVTNATTAKVRKYQKSENNGKIIFQLPTTDNIQHIEQKLVYKVEIKISKRNTLGTRIMKSLAPYYV